MEALHLCSVCQPLCNLLPVPGAILFNCCSEGRVLKNNDGWLVASKFDIILPQNKIKTGAKKA